MKTYNFWISLVSAVLLVARLVASKFNVEIDSSLVMDITTGLCGIFVVLGIISAPQKTVTKIVNNNENGSTALDLTQGLVATEEIATIEKLKNLENISNLNSVCEKGDGETAKMDLEQNSDKSVLQENLGVCEVIDCEQNGLENAQPEINCNGDSEIENASDCKIDNANDSNSESEVNAQNYANNEQPTLTNASTEEQSQLISEIANTPAINYEDLSREELLEILKNRS